jgi:putative phosphotransacetylase
MANIPVEITARHIHLKQSDFVKLFGKNRQLTVLKNISQPGQFASQKVLDVIGPNLTIKNVRIVGPFREKTQLEITATEARNLGINPPYHVSGQLKNAAEVVLKGPAGKLKIKAAIIPLRHLHLHFNEAKRMGLKNGQKISVMIGQKRKLTFHEIVVRSGENHKLAVHIDTDEANAAGLKSCSYGELIK